MVGYGAAGEGSKQGGGQYIGEVAQPWWGIGRFQWDMRSTRTRQQASPEFAGGVGGGRERVWVA
ncbi:MAG: hypothetical protein FWC28_00105 [Proteobacteria bacterium]|nr:hypothetical protein [Cystobacterineae bacterium]MCL2313644.1 hypothetical protein [Pseudomonadota bacterium]